ncbi:YraN family protein [Neopusillimonas aromaticivorans]|jgi:putative endonuclease|uniref:YraN family protein n=1 Tax=Neopusillimonas aromaticivorans TaxID=2979868 RepID=UPI002591D5B8|nr:YraN family protein [Neopusillimonas aromaticivorans]NLZ11149.1 YraN family protein [Alcaligenaceae bacterium]WJJ92763.1 YraN family protein [Neopusillimonas aromaticivorans]
MTDPELTVFELARAAQAKALKRRKRRPAAKQVLADDVSPAYSPSQKTGFEAEARAAAHLVRHGLHILMQNLRCRQGEIDLVANDRGTLVFVEVKYRNQAGFGGAAASVNRDKQRRMIRSARFFLPALSRQFYATRTPPCRFDVITIEPDGLNWLRGAFSC